METGAIQVFRFKGGFPEFFEKVRLLNAVGGGFAYKNGFGVFVEPDLTERLHIDMETLEIIHSSTT